MSIISITSGQTGLVGVLPSLTYIYTTDTISQVTTTGYLNKEVANGLQISLPGIASVSTLATPSSTPQVGWYQVVHVGSNWSLVPSAEGSIALPNAEIFVGNSGGVATPVPMSGQATIDNTGAVTIGNHVIDYINLALEVAALQSIALTSSQVMSLYATPFQILPDPAAGQLIIVDKVLYDIEYGTTQYTGGGNIFVEYGNVVHGGGFAASTSISAATFNGVALSSFLTAGGSPLNYPRSNSLGRGIYLSNDTAAFATGDSTMNVYVFYKVYSPT